MTETLLYRQRHHDTSTGACAPVLEEGTGGQQRPSSVRTDSAAELNGGGGTGKSMMDYARKLALAQAKAGLSVTGPSERTPDQASDDAPCSRAPSSSNRRGLAAPPAGIRRMSGAQVSSIRQFSAMPAGSSIRRQSSLGRQPNLRRQSSLGRPGADGLPLASLAEDAARTAIGAMPIAVVAEDAARAAIGAQPIASIAEAAARKAYGASPLASVAGAAAAAAARQDPSSDGSPQRLRWRRIARPDDGPEPAAANKPNKAAPIDLRAIAAQATAEDGPSEADSQPEEEQRRVLRTPSVRTDSAQESIEEEQLKIYEKDPADSPPRSGLEAVDWTPVLAAMGLSRQQMRAATDAKRNLNASVAALHLRRATLYKTLCSFAGTDADDDLESALFDCKQDLMKNEEAEETELRAFRFHFRCLLAGPLLAARSAAAEAAPSMAVDFLALADLIMAELKAAGDLDAPVQEAVESTRTRSRERSVNPNTIKECDEEAEQ